MRSLETVAKERMEVAVSIFCFPKAIEMRLTLFSSNNYPSGVKVVTKMSLTSLTSSVSYSTKSVNSRTNTSTDMISTVLL